MRTAIRVTAAAVAAAAVATAATPAFASASSASSLGGTGRADHAVFVGLDFVGQHQVGDAAGVQGVLDRQGG